MTCAECGGVNTVYQAFSGGKEYWCPDCEYEGLYEVGDAP
jgi:transposase